MAHKTNKLETIITTAAAIIGIQFIAGAIFLTGSGISIAGSSEPTGLESLVGWLSLITCFVLAPIVGFIVYKQTSARQVKGSKKGATLKGNNDWMAIPVILLVMLWPAVWWGVASIPRWYNNHQETQKMEQAKKAYEAKVEADIRGELICQSENYLSYNDIHLNTYITAIVAWGSSEDKLKLEEQRATIKRIHESCMANRITKRQSLDQAQPIADEIAKRALEIARATPGDQIDADQ